MWAICWRRNADPKLVAPSGGINRYINGCRSGDFTTDLLVAIWWTKEWQFRGSVRERPNRMGFLIEVFDFAFVVDQSGSQ